MKYLPLLFVAFFPLSLSGQTFIQMEKYGSLKVKKYYPGDQMTFRIKSLGNSWLTETIEDIRVEENYVVFSNRIVALNDITAIRSYRPSRWSKPWSNRLYMFGISWGGFSLLGTLAGWPLTWAAAIVPATSFAAGLLIRTLFKHKTYKLGKKRWLRALNLNPLPGP